MVAASCTSTRWLTCGLGLSRWCRWWCPSWIGGAPASAGEWLFAAPAGGPLRETNWQRSVSWREAKATIGRPELRVHDLRHTAASVWLASGADPKVVQRVLGH